MEMFKEGDLVFAKVTSRVPPWPAEVTKCLANNFYQVKCFGTDTVSDVKATSIVTYSSSSRARFHSSRNRKIKHFDLALDLIREKRRECECSSGCSVPIGERKKVKLTFCEQGENEISDIAKLTAVKKGKTPNKSDKTPNKKRKAEAMSVEKPEKEAAVNVRGILTNRIASKIISPVPKRRRTVNFAQSPSSEASAVSSENNTSTPLPLTGFSKGKSQGEARRQINFQNDNITDKAFNIVEELDETRDTIKKIMDMNQSKELTIHYLSLLMNEKKLVDEHKQNKKIVDKEYNNDKNLINSELDKDKVAAETESYSETADNSIFQSDNILHEERTGMIRKKKITFKSAKCLYNDEIDKDQTLLDYSDYNNCHQLAVDDHEQSDISTTIDTTQVPPDQMEVSPDLLHPATIVNPTILAEMEQAKDESCASSLLLRNISRSLDVNSNKDCKKSMQEMTSTLPCDSVFDALANQAKRETIDIVTSNVHLTNVIRELTAKAVVSYDGEMPEDEDVIKPIVEEENPNVKEEKSIVEEENPNVKEEKPIVDDVKPVVDDILQKSLDGSNSTSSDVDVSSDDFSESED